MRAACLRFQNQALHDQILKFQPRTLSETEIPPQSDAPLLSFFLIDS